MEAFHLLWCKNQTHGCEIWAHPPTLCPPFRSADDPWQTLAGGQGEGDTDSHEPDVFQTSLAAFHREDISTLLRTLNRKTTSEVTSQKDGGCFCKTPSQVSKHNHQVTRMLYWIFTHQDVSLCTFNVSCKPQIIFSKHTLLNHSHTWSDLEPGCHKVLSPRCRVVPPAWCLCTRQFCAVTRAHDILICSH